MQRVIPLILLCLSTLSNAAPADKQTTVLGGYPAQNLLDTGTDILGNAIDYPSQNCSPRIHSDIITMTPGQTGAKHTRQTALCTRSIGHHQSRLRRLWH